MIAASSAGISIAYLRYRQQQSTIAASYNKTDLTDFLEHKGLFELIK